jgi:methyltransferase (TIGR00027 family)
VAEQHADGASSTDVTAGVGKTALGVAMVRAQESRRGDRLFDDPYAAAFLDAAPGVFDTEQRAAAAAGGTASWGAAFSSHVVIRTRFYDDYLLDAAGDGLRQGVLLAAGLDTRAYRLAWPDGLRLFELDLPGVLRFKDAVLAGQRAVARCQRLAVPVDLRGDWTVALSGAGFRPGDPTVWLVEGLFIYLSADEAARLLTTISELSATGSRLAFENEDLDTDAMRAQARKTPAMAEYAAMWKSGLPDARAWLADHGWQPTVHDRRAVAAEYGRGVGGRSTGGFLTAVAASL